MEEITVETVKAMGKNQYFGILLAVFAGATLGGVVYHAMTCKSCKEATVEKIAAASAEMNGAGHYVDEGPRVVP